jgi:hypothetical protein
MPYIIASGVFCFLIGYCGARLQARRKMRGLYNRGWNNSREFHACRMQDETQH